MRRLLRLIYIGFIFARYRVDAVLLATPWFYPFRFLRLLNPFQYFHYHRRSRGENLRIALEQLGPIFIKFGQLLSTRRDFLPPDIADELARLQDKVKPFTAMQARRIIEKSLKKTISSLFETFDDKPLASASIAQVHSAVLYDKHKVVVKVLRPKVDKIIARDLSLLKTMAKLAQKVLASRSQSIQALAIVEEFERALSCELDLKQEAANASQLRQQSRHSKQVYIPEVYWQLCSNQIIVMEQISGIPIAKIEQLKKQSIDTAALGEHLIEAFFEQVFKYNFFHADLHPGNIFVSTEQLQQPQLILVDFGIAGSLNSSDQRYIAENLLAFFNRDYQRVAELHHASGWLPQQQSIQSFASAIRNISEPFFEKPLKEISIGQLLLKLFQTARRFQINIQPQLILLQKNLLHVEGISRQLNPELDLWTTAKPFLEKWMQQQIGLSAFLNKARKNLPYWLEKLPDMPDFIIQSLQNQSRPTQQTTQPTDDGRSNQSKQQLITILLFAASALNFAIAPQAMVSGWVIFAAAGVSLLWSR